MSPPSRRPVLMTADAIGGVWTYATSLARELCSQGFEITLVTLGPQPRSDQLHDIDGIEGLHLEATDLALEWMDPEGRDLPRSRQGLAEIERRVRPEVVHLNGFREAIGDWETPVISVAHSCVGSWWLACRDQEPSEPRWLEYLANVSSGLARADRWVAPTYAFRDTIQSRYSPPTRGRVIWNGIDASDLPPPFTPGPKQPVILAAGRLWDEAKNIAPLVGIAKRLPWPVQLVGRSVAPGSCESVPLPGVDLVGELPLQGLRQVMTSASIFVAPALYEPFGLTVLEAGRAGCALVLSDRPSFRELWEGAAIFVDPRDDRALQDALLHLIDNEAKRHELQRQAARRARRYSLAAMAQNYISLYDELAAHAVPGMVQHEFSGAAP